MSDSDALDGDVFVSEDWSDDADGAGSDSAFATAFVFDPAARSFFAQPDPLKWTVGGANALRIVPSAPQEGQNNGPGSWWPWRMSARWSHALQTYS